MLKIAVYVQHLLGTGHLVRAQLLAAALSADGNDVLLISGGRAAQTNRYMLEQLPVAKTAQGNFSELLDEKGVPVDDAWKLARVQRLLNKLTDFAPHIVIIETWPFGRRQMEFEILPMVEQLRQRPNPPMLVCSIRDVLQVRKQNRRLRTLEQIERNFSLILVHGDPDFIPLVASFPEQPRIRCPIVYTGYIHPDYPENSSSKEGTGEILVSAGGGAAGFRLLQIAADASRQDHRTWHLLVGPGMDDNRFVTLLKTKRQNLIVERNRTDFYQLLLNCAVSISQFGYNTALDILAAGCPAVIVPYAEGGETEQDMRASMFSRIGRCLVLNEEKLGTESLVDAVNRAARLDLSARCPVNLGGTDRSVEAIKQHFKRFKA